MIDTKDKEWVPIPDKSGLWEPETIGDELVGVYLKKEEAPFKGRPNWKYCFETEHPEAVNGKIQFYGTTGLNSRLTDRLLNKPLQIIFTGVKEMADTRKKPFKKFKIHVLLSKDDPLYAELKAESKPATPLADVEAAGLIDQIVDDLMDEHIDPTVKSILERAKKYHIDDKETLPAEILPRIEKELNRRG
mgnify:CR=1 FL=1